MSVESIIDAITGGGKPEDVAAAIGQQQRYDNYEVAEILAGVNPATATSELKEAMAKAKEEREKQREQMQAQAQYDPAAQRGQAQHAPAARGTATTQSQAQHEGARHAPARDA